MIIPKKFRSQRHGRKNITDYEKIAKELKDKVVFKVDLRKTNNTYTFGDKMALTKAAKKYVNFANKGQYHKISRVKGESKGQYRERLRETKAEYGQSDNSFAGIFNDVPAYSKKYFKRYKNEKGKWSTKLHFKTLTKRSGLVEETYIPITDVMTFLDDPGQLITKIYNENEFTAIYPVHGGFRSNGFGHDPADKDDFILQILNWFGKYKEDANFLSGFLIVTYG